MSIHTISTKQLRQEMPTIRKQLAAGNEFILIHRSKPIAHLSPFPQDSSKKNKSISDIAGGARWSEKLGHPLTPEFLSELAESRYDRTLP